MAQRAAAQAPLTESEVVRLTREQSPGAAVATATEALAGARERAAGRLPNPSLEWSRETISTAPSSSQDIVTATVPINLAAPLSTRSLAASDAARLRAQASVSRSDAVLAALLCFYEAVAAQRREALLEDAVTNLEEASRVLSRREQAGAASGYETSRLRIATELARSQRALARGKRRAAEARLARTLGLPAEDLQLPTALEPVLDGERDAHAHLADARPAALEHAKSAVEHAEVAGDRARWAWIPTLDVNLGLKRVSDFGGGTGYVVGLGLDVPVSDRGQTIRAEADAGRSLAAAQADQLQRRLQADADAALAEYSAVHEELQRFEAGVGEEVETLLRAARSGYREGHRTIVELLDAQRSATQVAQRELSLRLAAKRAEARLRAAAGDFQ